MKNYYPEKQIVPYKKTTVDMALVIKHINSLGVPLEVKRSTYIFFRNESTNGQKGINHNYGGFQADSGRWSAMYDNVITGIVSLKENQTGKQRLFLAFKDFTVSVEFLASRLHARGLYIGGNTHKIVKMRVADERELCRAYYKEWVKGSAAAEPTEQAMKNFLSMYRQAKKHFPI
jgi:hypothetical protein